MESINSESEVEDTYIVERLSSGSVCIRLSSNPLLFAIGQDEPSAMKLLSHKLLGEGSQYSNQSLEYEQLDVEVENTLIAIEELYASAPILDKVGFVFDAYQKGYLSVEAPFSKHKDFVIIHVLARLYYSDPKLLVFGLLAILILITGLLYGLVEKISDVVSLFL